MEDKSPVADFLRELKAGTVPREEVFVQLSAEHPSIRTIALAWLIDCGIDQNVLSAVAEFVQEKANWENRWDAAGPNSVHYIVEKLIEKLPNDEVTQIIVKTYQLMSEQDRNCCAHKLEAAGLPIT